MSVAVRCSLVASLAVVLLAGCTERSGSRSASSGSSKNPAPADKPASAAKGTSSALEVCADLAAQHRRLLASGGACTRDDQCACTGRGPLGCGGATDTRTARRLDTIRRLFALASCPVVRRCAVKQRCASVRCVAKRCVGAARG